jgi:hypothetical protein
VTFGTITPARQDIIKRLDALEKDNAELRDKLSRRPYKTTVVKPGMKADEATICAKFYSNGKSSQGYTIDAHATMKLHGWKPEELMETEWANASVQHRVKASLLNTDGNKSSKKKPFTVEEWLEHHAQGELSV